MNKPCTKCGAGRGPSTSILEKVLDFLVMGQFFKQQTEILEGITNGIS